MGDFKRVMSFALHQYHLCTTRQEPAQLTFLYSTQLPLPPHQHSRQHTLSTLPQPPQYPPRRHTNSSRAYSWQYRIHPSSPLTLTSTTEWPSPSFTSLLKSVTKSSAYSLLTPPPSSPPLPPASDPPPQPSSTSARTSSLSANVSTKKAPQSSTAKTHFKPTQPSSLLQPSPWTPTARSGLLTSLLRSEGFTSG